MKIKKKKSSSRLILFLVLALTVVALLIPLIKKNLLLSSSRQCDISKVDSQFDNQSCNKVLELHPILKNAFKNQVITQILNVDRFYAFRIVPFGYSSNYGPEGKVSIYIFDNTNLTKLAEKLHDVMYVGKLYGLPEKNKIGIILYGGAHVATFYLIDTITLSQISLTDPKGLLNTIKKQTGISFGVISNKGTINAEPTFFNGGFSYQDMDISGKYKINYTYNLDGQLTSTKIN